MATNSQHGQGAAASVSGGPSLVGGSGALVPSPPSVDSFFNERFWGSGCSRIATTTGQPSLAAGNGGDCQDTTASAAATLHAALAAVGPALKPLPALSSPLRFPQSSAVAGADVSTPSMSSGIVSGGGSAVPVVSLAHNEEATPASPLAPGVAEESTMDSPPWSPEPPPGRSTAGPTQLDSEEQTTVAQPSHSPTSAVVHCRMSESAPAAATSAAVAAAAASPFIATAEPTSPHSSPEENTQAGATADELDAFASAPTEAFVAVAAVADTPIRDGGIGSMIQRMANAQASPQRPSTRLRAVATPQRETLSTPQAVAVLSSPSVATPKPASALAAPVPLAEDNCPSSNKLPSGARVASPSTPVAARASKGDGSGPTAAAMTTPACGRSRSQRSWRLMRQRACEDLECESDRTDAKITEQVETPNAKKKTGGREMSSEKIQPTSVVRQLDAMFQTQELSAATGANKRVLGEEVEENLLDFVFKKDQSPAVSDATPPKRRRLMSPASGAATQNSPGAQTTPTSVGTRKPRPNPRSCVDTGRRDAASGGGGVGSSELVGSGDSFSATVTPRKSPVGRADAADRGAVRADAASAATSTGMPRSAGTSGRRTSHIATSAPSPSPRQLASPSSAGSPRGIIVATGLDVGAAAIAQAAGALTETIPEAVVFHDPLPPLKAPRGRANTVNSRQRGSAFAEVPLAAVAAQSAAETAFAMLSRGKSAARPVSLRPASKRCRMRPLEAWRNERLVYERPPGSKLPHVAAVSLNCGLRDSTVRRLPVCQLQATPVPQSTSAELFGLSNDGMKSCIVSLPAWDRRKQREPFTVALWGTGSERIAARSQGFLHVLDGEVRFAQEGLDGTGQDEIKLRKGDSSALTCNGRPWLVASTEEARSGARLLWVVVEDSPAPKPQHGEADSAAVDIATETHDMSQAPPMQPLSG
eukprot:TRINITY_DN13766_c1_g2_i1.p1 TRINITY_DN13766_c1_g2~~TRINITY_DN13766_c1_g2_i1.p1  ORF type:complete len:933 (+),score=150.71 TRINITY_DN13766_c1_g2_i1:1285-4083(+)